LSRKDRFGFQVSLLRIDSQWSRTALPSQDVLTLRL
jgi:hypothetical protein